MLVLGSDLSDNSYAIQATVTCQYIRNYFQSLSIFFYYFSKHSSLSLGKVLRLFSNFNLIWFAVSSHIFLIDRSFHDVKKQQGLSQQLTFPWPSPTVELAEYILSGAIRYGVRSTFPSHSV